jgi:hypothetical protein
MVSSDVDAVSREVIRYFIQHPSAVDSLEGIAHWRLLKMRVREVVDETDAALQTLVGRGLIDRIAVTGGPALFRLNPDKRDAARRLLEERA